MFLNTNIYNPYFFIKKSQDDFNNWTRLWVVESPGGNWNWTANYSMIRDRNSSQILIKPLATGYLTIKARLENECGCGNWLTKDYYVTQLLGGGHHFREND